MSLPLSTANLRSSSLPRTSMNRPERETQQTDESETDERHLGAGRAVNLVDLAFRYGPLPVMVIEPFANRILEANEAACGFLGLSLPELQCRSVHGLFAQSVGELISFTDEVLENQKGWTDELYIQVQGQNHNQGQSQGQIKEQAAPDRIRIEAVAKTLEVNDQICLQLVFQAFTDAERHRKEMEAHWHYRSGVQHWKRMAKVFRDFETENRLILDAAGEGIYGVDAEGLTTFLNPAAERMLGWSADELLGKNIHYTIHARHGDGSHYHIDGCPIYQAFQQGVVNSVDNEVFWHKDGHAIQVEYTSTPIKDGEQVVGAVVIFRDVSEKRLAQQQLMDALSEVETLRLKLQQENAYLQEEISSEFNHHQIVGKSPAIRAVLEKIQLVAGTDSTVLIHGESGTGKELIARAIHDTSARSERSLIRVNCAAIPADLFESEFFGHSKGAFTGATESRMGRFELADGGTLFLDEVGEIPLALQGKLLRVLQEQQFERVGESKTRSVNVRIIAATNQDLKARVAAGAFREDLYFRLNVFPIESVPLRQRKEDIPLLAQHFLHRAKERTHKRDLRLPLSQLERLKQYAWPGNIRELENIIERQVILARGNQLKFDFLQQDVAAVQDSADQNSNVQHAHTDVSRHPVKTEAEMKAIEKANLIAALQHCAGKVSGAQGAAAMLGIPATTLTSKLQKLGIRPVNYKARK